MYVRSKKTPNSTKVAIQLVETLRTGNTVKQKMIRHFGYAINDEEMQALKALAFKYKYDLEQSAKPTLFSNEDMISTISHAMEKQEDESQLSVNLKNIKEEKRIKIGLHRIISSIFDEVGFHKVFSNPSRKAASIRMMKNIVVSRIEHPCSKRASREWMENEYGVHVPLTSIYRMMDFIDDKAILKTNEASYQYFNRLFNEKIDIIFYDCTTLYFESFTEDELKQNGYSKDLKFNQPQVLLAMMVSEQGMPVGYQLFEGSKFEGHTLNKALELLYKTYKINKLVFVADSALLNRANIEQFKAKKQAFIVGARLKSLAADTTKQILDKSNYHPLYEEKAQQLEEGITYQEIKLKDEALKLIVTYSPKRAKKDAHDRENAIASLQKRIEKSPKLKSLLNNFGYKKFVTIKGEATLEIKQDKIKEAEQWDGLHGIITNVEDKTPRSLLEHYKGLWQIEETFRVSKSDLHMRPIFHWTTKRIKAHIAICFMALTCIRILEYRVRHQYKKLSPQSIIKSLSQLQVSILKDYTTNKKYTLPSKATQDAKKIFQLSGYRWNDTPQHIK